MGLMRIDMGPRKNFARAMDKGDPEQLKDLNRCTFLFDSPAVLVLAFHLLDSKVKSLGGTISRISNLLVEDHAFAGNGGALSCDCRAPPVVHIMVRIDGWTFEIMLALVDVIKAKER